MKVIADVEKQTLRMLENERSIFRGEYGVDKLELYINKRLENEYPTITGLLSNGRKIGPYTTDDAYSIETIDGVEYTKASFTLSEKNGFMLSEGKLQITIWMNSDEKKEAIGNVTLNVIDTTAFDDGDIIISGDVAGTIVNYRVELENLQSQINTSNVAFNNRITMVENVKADKQYVDTKDEKITKKVDANTTNISTNTQNVDRLIEHVTSINNSITSITNRVGTNENDISTLNDNVNDLYLIKADTQYVDEKFEQLLGEGANETLDTIGEIAKALQEHDDDYDGLLSVVSNKADKTEIPTKVSQLEQDVSVNADEVLEIVEENGAEVSRDYTIGTSDSYNITNDKQIITTKAVKSIIDNELLNYYTTTEIHTLLKNINTLSFKVVENLPTTNINTSTIYLVPYENEYEEFIYVNSAWEMLGTTKINISEYATKAYVDSVVDSKIESSITTALEGDY